MCLLYTYSSSYIYMVAPFSRYVLSTYPYLLTRSNIMNLIKAAAFAVFFAVVCFFTLSIVVMVAQTVGVDVSGSYPGVHDFLTLVKGTF